MTRYVEFRVTVVCEDDEVEEVFDQLFDAVDGICDGEVEGEAHECRREMTAGGCSMTEEQYEEEQRLEDILADLRDRERAKKQRRLKVTSR